MSENFVIGIGGTGARAVESMVHLCAMGYGPESLNIIIVDPDEANGNLTRTKNLIALYKDCQNRYSERAGTERFLFKTKIKTADPYVWNIFKEKNITLSTYIRYTAIRPELRDFASILFSEQELNTTLNEGFRGHPSIGAVVMSNPPLEENPWSAMWDQISDAKQNNARVFIVGSAFGGTGAAGVPTFGSLELIKYHDKAKLGENKSRVVLGGALILPYFNFEREDDGEPMYVTKDDFPIATKAALHYYNEKELGFDQLYFIGDSLNQKVGKFSVGSQTQNNNPHYIELVAALAGMDFFDQSYSDEQQDKEYFIAKRDGEIVDWTSLPVARDGQLIAQLQTKLKKQFIAMTTFGYVFCTYALDTLEKSHKSIELPWYREHFKFNEKKEKDWPKDPRRGENRVQINTLRDYMREFLKWSLLMSQQDKVRLLRHDKILKAFNTEDDKSEELEFFDPIKNENNIGLLLYEKKEGAIFGAFIKMLGIDFKADKNLSASNKLINIFYEGAIRFCAQNYKFE